MVSQSTLSSGQGRSVPVLGVSASCRARRLPCQLRPYFVGIGDGLVTHQCLEHIHVYRRSVRAFRNEFREQGLELLDIARHQVGGLGLGLAAVIFSMMFSVIRSIFKAVVRGSQLGFYALERQVQFHLARQLFFLGGLRSQAVDLVLQPLTISQRLPPGGRLFRCVSLVGSVSRAACRPTRAPSNPDKGHAAWSGAGALSTGLHEGALDFGAIASSTAAASSVAWGSEANTGSPSSTTLPASFCAQRLCASERVSAGPSISSNTGYGTARCTIRQGERDWRA